MHKSAQTVKLLGNESKSRQQMIPSTIVGQGRINEASSKELGHKKLFSGVISQISYRDGRDFLDS